LVPNLWCSVMARDPDTNMIGRVTPADGFGNGRQLLIKARVPLILFGFILLLVAAGDVLAPGFAAPGSLLQLLKLAAFMGIVAIGQTLVMLTGGIDLSVAWTLTAAAVVFTDLAQGHDGSLLIAIAAALGVGAIVGLANGVGVARLKISPIVVTLAMNNIMQGVTLVYTNGTPSGDVPELMRSVATGSVGPIPVMLIVWAILTAAVIFVLTATRAGRALLAVGENPRVSWLSGIDNHFVIIAAYTASGIGAALAGILFASFSSQAFLAMGDQFVLPSIAAVVLGGTSILGGRGGYGGTVIGVIFITLLSTVLIIENISPGIRNIVFGAVVIVALFSYRFVRGGKEAKL
jgi:ribose transport system permease protein